ncbi:hypothetical protein L9F63_020877, partial [Diploptera punctata]
IEITNSFKVARWLRFVAVKFNMAEHQNMCPVLITVNCGSTMSNTVVADTTDDHKSDNTLIIIVNNDGTISVDQETLQNLLANQQSTAVSVVRVGAPSQGDDSSQDSNGTCDSQNDGNPHVNLTVEGFYPPGAASTAAAAAATTEATATTAQTSTSEGPSEALVDPFLEMDSEQLERLETALQSEQAKQIFGEEVTAMLDMLSVEEETTQLTESIRMDHCYTNLSPSSAPATSTPNHQYGPVGSSDTDASDNSFEHETRASQSVVTTTPLPQPTRARGRGRGPGRPRREANSARSAQSYRGASARGTGRGVTKAGRGGTPGMVMVQQIKSINPPLAPPPTSPSSASLVPLIKPLIMTDRKQITTAITSSTPGQVTVQKQVVAVPLASGGTRLVTLTGTKLGQVVGGNRVLLTTNRTLQQQTQQQLQQKQQPQRQHQQQQKPKQQKSSIGQEATVATSNEEAQISGHDLVTSSAIPGMTVAPGEAKVLVAKMPTIPPQLLGAQPSTGLTEAMQDNKLPDESDFTHFPGREEENEDIDVSDDESDDQDVDDDDDDEYIGPGERRRGRFGKYRGGNRRLVRGVRGRGSNRAWDRGIGNTRGQGKVGVKRRGGRGRGSGRPEDIERAQRLEAEMAAALAAMDQSPEKDSLPKTVENERVEINKDNASKAIEKQEQVDSLDTDIVTPLVRKKGVKVYGKGSAKKKLTLNKDLEGKESEVTENKKTTEKITTPPNSEKKTPVKSPVRKHSIESSQPSLLTPSSTPTSTETPKVEKKNYPKRENRKPPAHLAEALGPALFSTPDIIRRVSTGSEQKTPTTPDAPVLESKKATSSPAEGTTVENVQAPPAVTAPLQAEVARIITSKFLNKIQFKFVLKHVLKELNFYEN